jgi:hypothetical protein
MSEWSTDDHPMQQMSLKHGAARDWMEGFCSQVYEWEHGAEKGSMFSTKFWMVFWTEWVRALPAVLLKEELVVFTGTKW